MPTILIEGRKNSAEQCFTFPNMDGEDIRHLGHAQPMMNVRKDGSHPPEMLYLTSGNFRLIQRLLTQSERIVQINALRSVSKEVVEVAREQLVIVLT